MFIQRKQAECFKDKKKTVNGHSVVVQVDFTENYISVEQECFIGIGVRAKSIWVVKPSFARMANTKCFHAAPPGRQK